ncbi:MAG: prefoldin subunit alpha [Thermoplasmatales archaeon]|nr:MAG: prefoldin subunit alpha [Thermoplasmatales archaeon]
MTKDEELAKYLSIIEQYKEQLNNLEMQSSYIQSAILDYNKAKITLENLKKTDKDKEILLPIGGSTFINANIKDPSNVLFDIGAGLVTEKKTEEAVKKIDKKIEELQQTQERVTAVMQNLQNSSAEITAKAQKLLSENENKQR